MKQIFIGIVVTLFVIGCQKANIAIEKDHLSSALKDISVDENIEWIVILPGLGCHGCIQEAEFFMKENIDNQSILFVLTKIESLKLLQQKIDITIKEHDNIYIDKGGLFDLSTGNSVYPCIIDLKDGAISHFEFQSPGNSNAFLKLKSQIDE